MSARAMPSALERLASVATLGTRRATSSTEELWPDPTLPAESSSNELSLLRAALANHLWRVAGERSTPMPAPEIEAFPASAGTEVSEAAAWRFGRMLAGERKELIPEWLACARDAGKHLPPHWVPVALEKLPPELCDEFVSVLGPAAAWLAARNPQWKSRLQPQEPSEERWHYGTLQERVAELRAMRRLDPAKGRAWTESTWASEPPEAREAFLKVFLIGLSPEDEPFLENALDDRRKGVRTAAAEALSRLPGSAFAQRALERAEGLLVLEQSDGFLAKLRKPKLEVRLSAALDKSAQRDGIEAKPPAQRKIGERAFWLSQMIALVPPAHWTQRFGCNAATFLSAAEATEHAAELLSALSAACERYPDPDWVQALCDAWFEREAENVHVAAQAAARLFRSVSPEQRAAILEAQLTRLGARQSEAAFALIAQIDEPWSAAITRLALEILSAIVRSDHQEWSHPKNTLDAWGRQCDAPTARPLMAKLLAECPGGSPWCNALEQMNDWVEFRDLMRQEILR